MVRLRTAVLLSGRGSNLQALINACAVADSPAEIALVLSNAPGAAGLDRARDAGIETGAIDHKDFPDRETFEERLTDRLEDAKVELVCLAGFMRLLTPSFVDHWRDRLINIHPSLLPAYKGLDTHARAIADGARFAGCTVHFVRAEMDAGPIIVQAVVAVHPNDSDDQLAARVLEAEHRCYPFALRVIAEGRVGVDNEIVRIAGATTPGAIVLNPTDG